MSFDVTRLRSLSRRSFVIGCIKVIFLGGIVSRLVYLQVIKNKQLFKVSENNRIKTIFIIPPRGRLLDRNNIEIASNSAYQRMIFRKSSNRSSDMHVIATFVKILRLDDAIHQELIKRYNNGEREFILYKYLSRDAMVDIYYNLEQIPNVFADYSQSREYKNSFAYSHFVGYISNPSKEEASTAMVYSRHPDYKIGKNGIEKYHNSDLLGKVGFKELEVNAHGQKIKDLNIVTPMQGNDLKLAIDSRLQEFGYGLTQEKKCGICVIDLLNGGILSYISTPSFDTNLLSKQIDDKSWFDYINHEDKPMLDRVSQSLYAPGSIFKLPVALAALENGFNPKTKFICNGTMRLGSRVLHCWNEKGHGSLDLREAIKHSCNIYFYKLANEISVKAVKDVGDKLGLESQFETFPFKQKRGFIPNEAWKEKILKDKWRAGDNVNLAIGQGFVRFSPLQLAVMTGRIATQKIITPYIDDMQRSFAALDIDQQNLDLVKHAMFSVVNEEGGTAYYSRIKNENMLMAGKTGTAQVVSKNFSKSQVNAMVGKQKPHGLFVGFAPFDIPRFAISVVVENGGFGASCAAPIGRDILLKAQELGI